MKTRFIIILFPILFLCISCNPDRNNPARTDFANLFPEKTESKCHILHVDFFLGKPYQIDILNNQLIIIDIVDKKLMTLYNIDTKKNIQLFQNGNGPTDLVPPLYISRVTKEGIIGIFQRPTQTYSEYKLSNLLQGNIEPIKAITFKENVDQLVPINDNYYIGCGVLENGSACMFDKTGKSVKTYTNTYPDFINNIKNPSDRYINGQQLISFNNKANTLLFASIFNGYINIFNLEKNNLNNSFEYAPTISPLEKNILNNKEYKPSGEDIIYFDNIYSTQNNFYLLYNGNALNNQSTTESNIFQFNSEGKPIRSINLDKKILDFCVDEKNQKIYGISLSDELDYVIIEIKI